MLRKTKILSTLGPATQDRETIEKLIRAGVNVFRLNMSHAKHDWTREIVGQIRASEAACGMPVAILMDLQGPSIRTGVLEHEIDLNAGDRLEIRQEGAEASLESSTTVNYPGLMEDVHEGDTMLVDNGVLHLRILETRPDRLICEVLTEGTLTSKRHINLPGIRVRLPGLTEKDRDDLSLAAELDVDFVALSFVRGHEHVHELRRTLQELGLRAEIVSKIEDQEAIKNLDEIIRASDAVMVARGDLGIEVHIEELPVIQRTIVQRCAVIGRKVIVATQMLESMIENPIPTRAEVTDVANAVFEQADALMLSGETSVGNYPVKCIEIFTKIAQRMEREPGANFCQEAQLTSQKHKAVNAAVVLANSIPDAAILVFTARGVMANLVAHLRPERAPIFALTEDPKVQRFLLMNRAVLAQVMPFSEDPEQTVDQGIQVLLGSSFLTPGQPIVILSDILDSDEGSFTVDTIMVKTA